MSSYRGQQIEVIDTAGLRKKGKTMQHGDAIDIKTSYVRREEGKLRKVGDAAGEMN